MLRTHLIRLASQVPALRPLLVPLLKQASWDGFIKARYPGKVPNPNSETKQRYPLVSVSTAMRDDGFRNKIIQEFHEWSKKGDETQKTLEPKEKKPLESKESSGYAKAFEGGTDKSIREFARANLVPNRKDLGPEAVASLKDYTGDGWYTSINSYLRTPDSVKLSSKTIEKARKRVAALDRVFDSKAGAIPISIQAVRAISSGPIADLIESTRANPDSAPGHIIQDNAFVSTSIRNPEGYKFGSGEYTMVINVPKGTRGVYLGAPLKLSEVPSEMELLLDRGTKFKVTNIDHKTNTCYVDVEPSEPRQKLPEETPLDKTVVPLELKPSGNTKVSPKTVTELEARTYVKETSYNSQRKRELADKIAPLVQIPNRVAGWLAENYYHGNELQAAVAKGKGEAHLKGLLATLDGLIKQSSVKEDCEVTAADERFVEAIQNAKDGDVIEHPYLQANIAAMPDSMETLHMVHLKLPKGTNALYSGPPNGVSVTTEMLLSKNTRFVVRKTDKSLTAIALPEQD